MQDGWTSGSRVRSTLRVRRPHAMYSRLHRRQRRCANEDRDRTCKFLFVSKGRVPTWRGGGLDLGRAELDRPAPRPIGPECLLLAGQLLLDFLRTLPELQVSTPPD
jgi:hypothetical protein